MSSFDSSLLDLSGLTQADYRQALSQLTAELERRRREQPHRWHRPEAAGPKQLAFHQDQHRHRLAWSGNRGGKTTCGAFECVAYALGEHPWRKNFTLPITVWIISPNSKVQREAAQPKILSLLPPAILEKSKVYTGQFGAIDTIILPNGSRIVFKSGDGGAETMAGGEVHVIWIDEPTTRAVYSELLARVVSTNGVVIGTMTIIEGYNSWIYNDIWTATDPEWGLHTWTMRDNATLSLEAIASFERGLTPEERQARIEGLPVSRDEQAYPELAWMPKLVTGELPSDFLTKESFITRPWKVIVGIDTGNRFGATWIAFHPDGRIFCFAEYFEKYATADENARGINDINRRFGLHLSSPMPRLFHVIDATSQFKPDLAKHGIVTYDGSNEQESSVNAGRVYFKFNKKLPLDWKKANPRFMFYGPTTERTRNHLAVERWERIRATSRYANLLTGRLARQQNDLAAAFRYAIDFYHRNFSTVPKAQPQEIAPRLTIWDKIKDKMARKRQGEESKIIHGVLGDYY